MNRKKIAKSIAMAGAALGGASVFQNGEVVYAEELDQSAQDNAGEVVIELEQVSETVGESTSEASSESAGVTSDQESVSEAPAASESETVSEAVSDSESTAVSGTASDSESTAVSETASDSELRLIPVCLYYHLYSQAF